LDITEAPLVLRGFRAVVQTASRAIARPRTLSATIFSHGLIRRMKTFYFTSARTLRAVSLRARATPATFSRRTKKGGRLS